MMDFIAHHAGVIGLLFFFGFFVVMTVWVFRPSAKKDMKEHGNIPLKGENEDE